MNHIIREKLLPTAFCAALALVFLTIFSRNSSPLYPPLSFSGDGAVFWSMGRWWTEGVVPLRDVFDHKGPLIYAFNALAWLVGHGKPGLLLVLTVCWTLTLVFAFLMLRPEFSRRWAYGLTAVVALAAVQFYTDTDCVEEYNLPLLMLSFLLVTRWYSGVGSRGYAHPPLWAGVYGMALGAALMLRATNGLAVFGAAVVICGVLVYKRLWRNALLNVAAALAGFALVVLPFVAYYWAVDGLSEMWFCTFTFNVTYSGTGREHISLLRMLYGAAKNTSVVSGTAMLLAAVGLWRGRARVFSTVVGVAATLLTLWYINSNNFPHYGLVSLSFVPLCFIMARHIMPLRRQRVAMAGLVLIVSVHSVFMQCVYTAKELFGDAYGKRYDVTTYAALHEFVSDVDGFSLADCAVLDFGVASFYQEHNLRPKFRLWFFEDYLAGISPVIRRELRQQYATTRVTWVIADACGTPAGGSAVADILARRYRVVKHDGRYTLYRLRQP